MPHSLADGRKRPPFDPAARRRRSLLTNLLVLAAGAAALLCFIAVLADARRAGNAMRQAAIQVDSFTRRMGGTEVLPLNLEPHVPDDGDPRLVNFESIASVEALNLRNADGPILVAWSSPVFRLFGADRRAVVVFEKGRFRSEWMFEAEFQRRRAAQHESSDR